MKVKLNIIFDNAPSSHKEGILEDFSRNSELLIVHLPAIKDNIHFSEISLEQKILSQKRLYLDPYKTNKYIKNQIKNFLKVNLGSEQFDEINLIFSFIDLKRLFLVNHMKNLLKNHGNNLSIIPHYEPVRLNDLFIIPRLVKFFIGIIYQKLFFRSNTIYLFSKLNSKFYGLFFRNLSFFPYKQKANKIYENYFLNKKTKEKNYLTKKKLNILFVGKLIDRKNPLLLIEACKKLYFPIQLSIYGEGYLHKKIKNKLGLIKKNNLKINLYGNVNNDNIINAMLSHDVLVLPSKFDGFGFVVYEALKSGINVIVSDQVGAKDILNSNGSIFSSLNEDELINLLNLNFFKKYF